MESSHFDKSYKILSWKRNIEKLLFKSNICGICLYENEDLSNLESFYHIENSKIERKLKDIIELTFGHKVASLLPTSNICPACVTDVLKSYFIARKILMNHTAITKYIEVLTQQSAVGSGVEPSMEKQLLLTIDNVNSLNVPTTVTLSDKENITKIFLCEVEDLDTTQPYVSIGDRHLKYECPYCGKQFEDYVSFKDHHTLHNEAYFRCYKCQKRFKYFGDLSVHRTKVHSDILMECDTCEIFLLSTESCEHVLEHPEKFYCSECKITFKSQFLLRAHDSKIHVNFNCNKCFKSFRDSMKLLHHRCPFKCSECKDDCVHEKYLESYRNQYMANKTLFECRDCEFTYATKNQIISHVNLEHLNHMPYLCDLCGDNFASGPLLTSHMNRKHADIRQFETHFLNEGPIVSNVLSERPNNKNIILYRCTECVLDFKLKSDLIQHTLTHPKGGHKCRECRQTFHSKIKYISHVRKHRINYIKTCPICLKKYTEYSISRHIKQQHSLKDTETIICDVCEEMLPDEKALLKHANKHNEQRQCPHCEMSINSVLYSKHISTHLQTKKQRKSCLKCNYTTKFSVCLEAHINRYHLKVRPFKCELCSKRFYSSYSLRDHKAIHKIERPQHLCQICGKKFISKKALLLHTRIHTGEQPYPCNFCDLSFISSSRRSQHMIRKHYEPQFGCEICLKKLFTQSDLKRHMGDCHNGEYKRKNLKKSSTLIEK